ncbi:hypothetical protein SEA_MALISHA_68 [Gordonia phage Malisha]|nr:hypothetical protein SEA_MALISHA_68 [Gordonia phage Malisha]
MTGNTIDRAWHELAELVRHHEGILTINHWERPNGDLYHRVAATGFLDLGDEFEAESPDLAEALDQVRVALAMRTPTPLRIVR